MIMKRLFIICALSLLLFGCKEDFNSLSLAEKLNGDWVVVNEECNDSLVLTNNNFRFTNGYMRIQNDSESYVFRFQLEGNTIQLPSSLQGIGYTDWYDIDTVTLNYLHFRGLNNQCLIELDKD